MLIKMFNRVENVLFYIAVGSIFAMMVLVSVDVVFRYVFNSPLEFQFELTTNYLMVMSIVLAMSWGAREGAFIKVTLMRALLPESVRRWLIVINCIIVTIIFLLISWKSLNFTIESWNNQEYLFGVIEWPVWLSRVWVPVGSFTLAIRMVVQAFRYANHKNMLSDDDPVLNHSG